MMMPRLTVWLLFILVSGCSTTPPSPPRDISTIGKAVLGHWRNGRSHLFFDTKTATEIGQLATPDAVFSKSKDETEYTLAPAIENPLAATLTRKYTGQVVVRNEFLSGLALNTSYTRKYRIVFDKPKTSFTLYQLDDKKDTTVEVGRWTYVDSEQRPNETLMR